MANHNYYSSLLTHMNSVQRLPKGLLSFLAGLFLCLGANQAVGIVAVPVVFCFWFFANQSGKESIVAVIPILSISGIIFGFITAYIALQINTEKWFRRGIAVGVILSILQLIGGLAQMK